MGFMGLFLGFLLCFLIVRWVLKHVNYWYYEIIRLGEKRHELPPGDLGWPFIGNMLPFLRAFKSKNPETFISSFVKRYGNSGLYTVHMFGNPSIIVTTPESCRKVLTDDEAFRPGWPVTTANLIGKKSFVGIFDEEHRWLRKLTSAPINGHEALITYLKFIEENVSVALDEWSKMGQFEFLTHLRKLTFRIIMHIFMSSSSEHVMKALEREYTILNYGIRAMAINLPGFVYHKALKARKRLVAILQSVVTDRRELRKKNPTKNDKRRDMMDRLMDAEDENGRRLTDEEIIDVMVMYLNAGHESSGHTMMWAALFLQKDPHVFKKAKAEQEAIVKNRPADQEGLTLKEVRQMEYLNKVIDETLRVVTVSLTSFKEAKKDVNVCGYTIPKGWKVIVWFRSVHYDPETYLDPKKFDPSRWDGFIPRAGQFLPFGGGSRMCPGNDLAKLEIAIFLHHFLLNYEFEHHNPESPLMYLPHTRPKDNCLGRIKRRVSA